MKTCPDCAESIQDDARKCRFCGFRFEAASANAHLDESVAAAAPARPVSADAVGKAPAPTTSASRWPFLVVASGAMLVALGGLAMGFLLTTGGVDPRITVGSFATGGLLLAIGWGLLLPRGDGGFGALFGGLVLASCWIVGAVLDVGGGPAEQLAKGLLGTVGLLLCALLHLNTLEKLDLDGARLAAILACLGFGAQLFAISRKIALPEALQIGLMWAGLVGTLLLGGALALGAISRWSESRAT